MLPAPDTDDEDAQVFWEGLLNDEPVGSGEELVADESRLCLSGVGGGRECGGGGEGVQGGGGKGGVRTCCFFALSLLRRAHGSDSAGRRGLQDHPTRRCTILATSVRNALPFQHAAAWLTSFFFCGSGEFGFWVRVCV